MGKVLRCRLHNQQYNYDKVIFTHLIPSNALSNMCYITMHAVITRQGRFITKNALNTYIMNIVIYFISIYAMLGFMRWTIISQYLTDGQCLTVAEVEAILFNYPQFGT